MSKKLITKLVCQDYHRNGVSGNGFNVAIFESDGKRMIGIVLSTEDDESTGAVNCFVLDLDKAAAGDIAFGSNSWRGDHYAAELRALIEQDEQRQDEERTEQIAKLTAKELWEIVEADN